MQVFTKLTAIAAPLAMSNVDTDQIIPARYLWMTRKDGFKDVFLRDLRFHDDGSPVADFSLNRPEYADARILVSGRNFGCGSSRELAVWALLDAGIRAVVAPSFSDIFSSNSLKNGLLPVALPEPRVVDILAKLHDAPGAKMTVDLDELLVLGPDGQADAFSVEAFQRDCLLQGIDDIEYTLKLTPQIEEFSTRYGHAMPWLK